VGFCERLGCPESRRSVISTERAAPARRALRDVTVLDPAVGSARFSRRLELLSEKTESGDGAARRRVHARELFGVDFEPAAVRLTELRRLARGDREDRAAEPSGGAAPNLFGRQGDSLLIRAATGRQPRFSTGRRGSPGSLRRALMAAAGADKRCSPRPAGERRAAFRGRTERAEAARTRRLPSAWRRRSPTLFGERAVRRILTKELRGSAGHAAMYGRRPRFRETASSPGFTTRASLPTYRPCGFDLVVGNPPWCGGELPAQSREELRRALSVVRSGSSTGFAHRPDLALAFFERAWELTGPAAWSRCWFRPSSRPPLTRDRPRSPRRERSARPPISRRLRSCVRRDGYPMALVVEEAATGRHRVRTVLTPPRSPSLNGVPSPRAGMAAHGRSSRPRARRARKPGPTIPLRRPVTCTSA